MMWWICGGLGIVCAIIATIPVVAQWGGAVFTAMQAAGLGLFIVPLAPLAATAPAQPAPTKPAPALFAAVFSGPLRPRGAPLPAPIVLAVVVPPGATAVIAPIVKILALIPIPLGAPLDQGAPCRATGGL